MSIRFVSQPELANIITHDGNFHADDIFSLVLLEKILGDLAVFRIANINPEYCLENFNSNALVIDIGYGEFDHHQKGGNGSHFTTDSTKKAIPYATFGLLWKKFGKEICDSYAPSNDISEKLWKLIEENLVIGIDATDNGVYPCSPEEYSKYRILTISNVITSCNPINSIEEQNLEAHLAMAIEFARFVFEKTIENQLFKITQKQVQISEEKGVSFTSHFNASQIFAEAFMRHLPSTTLATIPDFSNMESGFHAKRNSLLEFTKLEIPFSDFGKVWNLYGKDFCKKLYDDPNYPDYVWEYVRTCLVSGIDAIANDIIPSGPSDYVDYNLLCLYDFIESLNLMSYTDSNYKESKEQAIQIASFVIDRFLAKTVARISNRVYVESKILETTKLIPTNLRTPQNPSRHILVLDKHVHWQEWVSTHKQGKNIWFVISPSNKGGYVIQPVPNKFNQNGYRKGFPKKWWGLNGEQLKKVTKNSEASFVHESFGFIAGAQSLEGAIALCERAFSHRECERIKSYER